MRGQHQKGQAFFLAVLAWVGTVGMAACDRGGNAASGLHFQQTESLLGSLVAGTTRTVGFSFEVLGEPVVISKFNPQCGCLHPRLWVNGQEQPLGRSLAPGTQGQILVDFVTVGFEGEKNTGIEVLGQGPGFPQTLSIRSYLRPWFTVEPSPLRLGILSPDQDHRAEIRVQGPESFRLQRASHLPAGLQLEGLPSAEAATEQRFQVVIPAGTAEGRHTQFLRIEADNQLQLQLAVDFEIGGEFWLRPARKLLLGSVAQGISAFGTVELGVREGELLPPTVEVEGLPGVESRIQEVEPGKLYKLTVATPGDLAPGAYKFDMKISVGHRTEAALEEYQRTVTAFLVVKSESSKP
ncbi:MAG: DUF1573 domain-containing protein [Planctomycetota bacterium]|nr:MAG: DUF1573 domain-containing protein [Planctomycetota bacterium]